MKRRFNYIPLWVEIVYRSLEWLDYSILAKVSGYISYRRFDLLDDYCTCDKCLLRDPGKKHKKWRKYESKAKAE